jgi:hypothetical protein
MRLSTPRLAAILAIAFAVSTPVGSTPPTTVPPASVSATADDAARGEALRSTVVAPALRAWFVAHRDAWAPTEAEIDAMVAWIEAANRCPGRAPTPAIDADMSRQIATAFVAGPKKQRFLQRRFGGERVLWQQFGVEAFDATYRLILSLEQEGRIVFATPADRALALDYWTRDQGAWLSDYKSDDESFRMFYDAPPCPTQ